MQAEKQENVSRVIIVSKTHLDVGFTDYAQAVLDRYVKDYIPKAVRLAGSMNTDRKKFVWTAGSYLIRYALEHSSPEDTRNLQEAIRNGDVRYHALPLTTHSELMNERLFRYGISIAEKLDAEFGLHTRAAKMTDVPGHTEAIVPIMARAGIRYLHIGVNASSRVPKTPPVFRWRQDGEEIAVSYSGDYATPLVLSNGAALEMLHTHDNFGPPSEEDVERFYEEMREKYPNAELIAGTLDDFSDEIEKVWNTLPVVEQEIGDTWIHGVASDPVKTSDFKRLLSLSEKWIRDGELTEGTPAYETFFENMLLVAEHTWGMDVKKYLLDFSNWTKRDFSRALKKDVTSYDLYGEHNRKIFEGMKEELLLFRGNNPFSSYSDFAKSHTEQREYLTKAMDALSPKLRKEAKSELKIRFPKLEGIITRNVVPRFSAHQWKAEFDEYGTLIRLKNEEKKLDRKVQIGRFLYETFDGKTVQQCYREYGRDLDQNWHWAECDFGKPGLEYVPEIQNHLYHVRPVKWTFDGTIITIYYEGEPEGCRSYGCPRELAVTYQFDPDGITVMLYWKRKDPIRSPEALWFEVDLKPSGDDRVLFKKLGGLIDPADVISGGNRKLHAVEEIQIQTAAGTCSVIPYDSPLVSVGGRHLYDVDDRQESPEDGLSFLLCNNRWGTNFPQWFGENARFSYRITVQ